MAAPAISIGSETGRALEIGAGQGQLVLGQEDRVVAHAVQLDLDLASGISDGIVRRADHLGRGAHRVGILDFGLDLAGHQVAALDAFHDRLGGAHRAGEAAQLVQAHVVGFHIGQQRFQAHGAGDLGLLEPAVHIVQVQGAHGGQQVRAVDGCQPVARLQAGDRDAGPFHGLLAGQALALVEGFAFAHQQQGDLRHRRQVAAGADRAFLANHRRDAFVEHLDQGQGDLRAAAGIAVGVHVDAPGHGGAHILDGRRVADPGGMVVDQVALELLHLLVVQHDFGKFADAGVDAVHDLVRLELFFQHGPAGLDPLERIGVQFHLFAMPGDAHQFFEGQI